MIPLLRGAAEQIADPLANWYNQMYSGMDETMRQIGIEPPERREVTQKQIASPLTFFLGAMRGKIWKSSLRGAVQKGPSTPKGMESKGWLSAIKKEKGAWAEARKTGLDKFLEANPKPSQAELLSFLDQSGIELTETIKRDMVINLDSPFALPEVISVGNRATTTEGDIELTLSNDYAAYQALGNKFPELLENDDWAEIVVNDVFGGDTKPASATKYANEAKLNLPGGENPKEILIQLETANELYEKELDEVAARHGRFETPSGYNNYATPEEVAQLQRLAERAEGETIFTEGHFDEDNVIVHVRLNDRTVGGVYSKHAEEYQSDWAQKAEKRRRKEIKRLARDEGISREAAAKQVPKDWAYQVSEESPDTTGWVAERTDDHPESWIVRDAEGTTISEGGRNLWYGTTPEEAIADAASVRVTGAGRTFKLPDQPYKDDPFELAWRRHFLETLRDPKTTRMTWTTGDVQKDRYNLSKYINSIDAHLQKDGTYNLKIFPKTGPNRIVPGVHEFDLEDHVGKELADKIAKDAESEPQGPVRRGVITYSGLDLEMGGKFHKFIYDKKVPQYAKEFLKNYRDANGNKIVPKRISAMTEEDQGAVVYDDEGERYFISPDYVSGDFDIIQGSGTEYDEDTDQWMRTFNTLKEAQEGLKDFGEPKKGLWYIDTTPEMEEDHIEGVSLTMDTTKEQQVYA